MFGSRAAATRGHHATDTPGDHTRRRLALAARSVPTDGEGAGGPRPNAAADALAPLATVGGGLGYELDTEGTALAALALAVVTEARRTGTRLRWALRAGLIGDWPWLHISDATTGHSLGVSLVVGRAWVVYGPHVDRKASGPYALEHSPTDPAPLARILVRGVGRGLPAGPLG